MTSMLGKQVKVTLAEEGPESEKAIAEGQLLKFSEDGEIAIRDEMGIIHYCWPNLKTELV